MQTFSVVCVFVLSTVVLMFHLSSACDPSQTRQGCRIQDSQCICGVGCYSEYRYSNKDECVKALKGKRQNICDTSPCYHGGICTQTFQDNKGYKCRCSGTGYYGKKCQYACPTPIDNLSNFPYECIVI